MQCCNNPTKSVKDGSYAHRREKDAPQEHLIMAAILARLACSNRRTQKNGMIQFRCLTAQTFLPVTSILMVVGKS